MVKGYKHFLKNMRLYNVELNAFLYKNKQGMTNITNNVAKICYNTIKKMKIGVSCVITVINIQS